MYGKIFETTFTGSMYGAGPDIFAVWAYVIAHTKQSRVELNEEYLSPILGMTPERILAAIQKLSEPDARSRCREHEGRRLVRDGQFQFFVPAHEAYKNIRNEEERRTYNRLAKQAERDRKKAQAGTNGPPASGELISIPATKPQKPPKKEHVYGPDVRAALHYLNEKTGLHFEESSTSLGPIQARMSGDGIDFDGVKKMIDHQYALWKGTPQEVYMRPSTLFSV